MSDEVKVFENDRDYTYEAMMEQFNLVELDLRDGFYKHCASIPEKMLGQLNLVSLHYRDKSWQECKCSFEKHLPTVLGLAKDGLRQTDDEWQQEVLGAIRDDALKYKRRLEEGQLTKQEARDFGKWVEMAIDELDTMQSRWPSCIINTSVYINTLAGLSGEGVGFTEDENEKKYMRDVRDTARTFAYRIASADQISQGEADAIRAWAREQRRRLSRKLWVGELPKTSRKDEDEKFELTKKQKEDIEKKREKQNIDKKKILKGAKKMDENGKECKTCTTIPDKYLNKEKNNGGSKEDYIFVSAPDSDGEVQMPVGKQRQNPDIQWIVR